jgi:tetratricopeptide (TPR) repeat protein
MVSDHCTILVIVLQQVYKCFSKERTGMGLVLNPKITFFMSNLKPFRMKKSFFSLLPLMLILLLQFSGSCSSTGNKADEEVQKAFQLRMNGKADQAKLLLESIIAKDSTNAMAYYELARLTHYMLVGGGEGKIENIISSIDNAVSNDPDNVIYAYYKGISSFLNAFFSMQHGNDKVKPLIAETCIQFEKVLKLKPDYYEAMMYLVEIYGMLPADMGGDSLKAIAYADKLGKMNSYFGARAKAVLLPENSDRVRYWENFLASDTKNPELLTEVGKAYLFKDDPENAEKYFIEAKKLDPSKNILILDLARYHIMKVMENKDLSKTELPVAKGLLEKYLKSSPEPIVPLKAYTMGLLVRVDMFLGNQSQAEKLMEETKALDPYFSRASGIPTLILFDPPDKICHHYFSFFSPF